MHRAGVCLAEWMDGWLDCAPGLRWIYPMLAKVYTTIVSLFFILSLERRFLERK